MRDYSIEFLIWVIYYSTKIRNLLDECDSSRVLVWDYNDNSLKNANFALFIERML